MVEEVKLKRIKIGSTEILLENYELGKGKIIISDPYYNNYSFYWGAMGDTIEEFLKRTDEYYFAGKLCNESRTFCGKRTAKGIRRYIKEEMSYDLPWYKYMSAQKEMREQIKRIENSDSEYLALSIIECMHENIMCYDLSWKEEKDFIDIIKDHFRNEPWHFLEKDYSKEYKWLIKLHKNLIKKL